MKKIFLAGVFSVFSYLFLGILPVFADTGVNSGDTAWVLISSAMVMFMTPGLALFYAGMARAKNVLGTIMHSFVILCLISVQWVLWGYTLSFGNDIGGVIGGLNYLGLNGVGLDTSKYSATFPHQAFMIFQGMFAVITPALITGTFAERIKFSAFLLFSILWATFVYDPLCHWVWGGGWLGSLGALDFAGGNVVHISSGISALVACLVIGKRRGFPHEAMPPHNLPMTVIGAAILWFGWFGFNAGSALSANGIATSAFVVTNTAAAAAALAWLMMDVIVRGKPTALGAVSGAVAGLVAITPASGYVGPISSIIIGFVAGMLCFSTVSFLKPKMGYDDSLDVFGIHGVGGTWGALATGLFASTSVNPGGANGLFFGNPKQFVIQLISVAATIVFVAVLTYIILMVVKAITGLRVNEDDEEEGLDLAVHGERGYNY